MPRETGKESPQAPRVPRHPITVLSGSTGRLGRREQMGVLPAVCPWSQGHAGTPAGSAVAPGPSDPWARSSAIPVSGWGWLLVPRLFAGQEHMAHWNQVSWVCFYWGRPFLACLKRKSLQRQVKGCCAPQGSNLDQDSLFLALKGKVRRGIVSGHVLRAFLLPDVPRLTSGPACRCSPPALSAQRAAAQASASPAVPPATPKHLESGCSEGSCSELGIQG